MKKVILLLFVCAMNLLVFSQDKEAAEALITEGIALHDNGDFTGAIAKYDKALELDKDNLLALAEKAFSLMSAERYDETIVCCKRAIAAHPGDPQLNNIYTSYGTALDGLQQSEKAIVIYDEGIKFFPGSYQLYYNRSVTLYSLSRVEEALDGFQQAIVLNPDHGSSHNAIARIMKGNDKRIQSLLAYWRFLVVEPEGKRAHENFVAMQELMGQGVEKTGKKSVSISVTQDMLGDTTAQGKPNENSFAMVDLLLTVTSALDYDKKNKKKSPQELFISKLETVCASMEEAQKENRGFFWTYYAPYFIEMKQQNLLEPFAYIAFATSGDSHGMKWIKENAGAIEKFYDWSNDYSWKMK